jgi:hypothetical protein
MEDTEKLFKSLFAGAANQLTQLYVQSLQQQKTSFSLGYNSAIESMTQFILCNNNSSGANSVINLDLLLDFLKQERTKYPTNTSIHQPNSTPTSNPTPTAPPRTSASTPVSTSAQAPSPPDSPVERKANQDNPSIPQPPPITEPQVTVHNRSAIACPFQPPTPLPQFNDTTTSDIFIFSAEQQPLSSPLFSQPFSFDSPTSPVPQQLFRRSPHRHTRLLQQSQFETASRKRQIDRIFNPSGIVEVLAPMDKLLKKIKIDGS